MILRIGDRFRIIGVALVGLAIATHTACIRPRISQDRAHANPRSTQIDFADLKPGSTVTVVIPLLRSGGYVLDSVKRTSGTDIQVGDDFLGYERDYYQVTARHSRGVHIRFQRAESWKGGKTHSKDTPIVMLFDEASGASYVRLVHLVRESVADHNMAIVWSDNLAALDELTRSITHDGTCQNTRESKCRWVPEGISVTVD